MNNKYEARIFSNGRVVLFSSKDLDDAIAAGKELLIVCNCSFGGASLVIGGNVEPNWDIPGETVTFLYSHKINYQVFTGEEMAKFHKVIFTDGEKIFDDDFDYATRYSHTHHCFYNGDKKMRINEKKTARYLNREQVKTMIEIGVLSEKALNYCIEAVNNKNPIKDSVNEYSN